MGNCNFEKDCPFEAEYVCQCLNSETLCCEIHLKEHLKALDRDHTFDSISTGLCEWTKDGFLEFLWKEKLAKKDLREIVLDFFAQNSNIPTNTIEKYLNKLDSNLKDISENIENISQVSEKEEHLLVKISNLQPESDAESAENNFSNSLDCNFKLFYSLGQLKHKRQAILSKPKNDPEIEQDFRRTCALYQNCTSNFLLRQAYKEYINDYQKLTSLYLIYRSKDEIKLFIYDTESHRERVKILNEWQKGWDISVFIENDNVSMIQLPNNELFVYATKCGWFDGCIINILDWSYRSRYLPKKLRPQYFYTAIYFNKSIYCFGYYSDSDDERCQLSRFDLYMNKWVELAPMERCHNTLRSSIIFKKNILFSENECNLFFYSIEINSFSTIPYKFAKNTAKILINGEERLYLIECGKNRWIYESGAGDEYNWQKISLSKIHDPPSQFYISYNKRQIYISIRFHQYFREYFKFDLRQKELIEIACYGDSIALEYLDGKLERIEHCGKPFKLDSYYNKLGNHPFYIALRLDKIEKCPYEYIEKGCALCELGKDLEALESFNKSIWINPRKKYAYVSKGAILSNLGRDLEELDCYNELIIAKPNYWYGYLFKGLVLHCLERNIEAIECYNEALIFWPYSKVYFHKGVSLNYLGRNAEAIECYNEIIKSEPKDEYEYCLKGDALHKLGRNLEALECYNEAIKIEPNYWEAYWKKGCILHDFGQYLEAIECYNEVIRFNPTDQYAYGGKGRSLYSLGRNIEALECYTEAIELDPHSKWAYWKKGEVLLNLERNLEAIDCINKSVKLHPDNYIVFCCRATLFNDLGQVKKAAKDFETAYKLNFNKNSDNNDVYVQNSLELQKMLIKLLENAVKTKKEFQKIKNSRIKTPEIFNEAEEKESKIKEQRSQIFKRAIECWLLINDYPIEEMKKLKAEVAEHQKTMIDTVANLWGLLDLQRKSLKINTKTCCFF